jgi:hypothetical protein
VEGWNLWGFRGEDHESFIGFGSCEVSTCRVQVCGADYWIDFAVCSSVLASIVSKIRTWLHGSCDGSEVFVSI